MATSRTRTRGGIAVLVTLSVVVAACSGDDSSDEATTTTATAVTTLAPSGTDAPAETTAAPEPEGPAVLTVGYLAPGVGLLGALAIGQERGLTLAVDEINASGGVLGAPIATVRADESATEAMETTVDSLTGQGANVLVGPVGSASAASLLPILAQRNLLTCSASATSVNLTAAVDTTRPLTFVRTALRDDYFASIVADQVAAPVGDTPPPASVMIVARDDVYGNDFMAGLSAELTTRGVAVTTLTYPARRVQFPDEAAAVAATNADKVVLVAYEEAPQLVSSIVNGGYPADRIVGLDGMLVPRLAEQTFPTDPNVANGLTVYGPTGDRALINRLRQVQASQDQVSYGPQMYDCVITLALAAIAAGSVEPASIAAQIGPVTAGGRTCSTFAHCVELLAAGEDIDYDGTTGRLAIDVDGDVTTERITTARVIDGQLQPVSSQDIDLTKIRAKELFASAVFTAQLQQALKLLGFYDGEITGIYDDATRAAVAALQTSLGLPATGEYDEATDAALRERLGGAVGTLSTAISQVQQALTDLGFYTGPIDGRWSQATIDAVRAFQTELGVPATGVLDVATMQAIHQRGVEQGVESVPTTTTTTEAPTTTTQPPDTPAPETAPPDTPAPPTAAPTAPPTAAPPTEPPTTTTVAPEPEPDDDSLYAVLGADPRFATLMELVNLVGADDELQRSILTVFAPTDDAFTKMPAGELDALRKDPTKAAALLRELALPVHYSSANLPSGDQRTVSGGTVAITNDGAGNITYAGVPVTLPELTAVNGTIFPLSAVPALG